MRINISLHKFTAFEWLVFLGSVLGLVPLISLLNLFIGLMTYSFLGTASWLTATGDGAALLFLGSIPLATGCLVCFDGASNIVRGRNKQD